MSAGPRAERPAPLRALWRERPAPYSRALWALVLALDYLPWPWGEDALAALFALVGMARGSRRRAALGWAARYPERRRWPLAMRLAAFRGRWVAQAALLGVRAPADLAPRLRVEGAEWLTPSGAGTILLGFHLGPPGASVALRLTGHPLAWLGGALASRGWSRPGWRPLLDPGQYLAPAPGTYFWPGYLVRARRILQGGGTIFVMAGGTVGQELFRVPPRGPGLVVKSGWLALCRQTGARVLPVLTHLAGRLQVVTVHPPLPALPPDPEADLGPWRALLTDLVIAHMRRVPEQCPSPAFEEVPPRGLRPGLRAG